MGRLNETMDAATAQQAGLIYRVTKGGELGACTLALARRFANGPVAGQAAIKRLINFSPERTLEQHLQTEKAAFLVACDSVDFAQWVPYKAQRSRLDSYCPTALLVQRRQSRQRLAVGACRWRARSGQPDSFRRPIARINTMPGWRSALWRMGAAK